MNAIENLTTVHALAVIGGIGMGVLLLRHSLRRILLKGGHPHV